MLSAFSESLLFRVSLDEVRAVPLISAEPGSELMFLILKFINSDMPMSKALTDSFNDPRQ